MAPCLPPSPRARRRLVSGDLGLWVVRPLPQLPATGKCTPPREKFMSQSVWCSGQVNKARCLQNKGRAQVTSWMWSGEQGPG